MGDIPILGRKPPSGPRPPGGPQEFIAAVINQVTRMQAQIHALHVRVSELEKGAQSQKTDKAEENPPSEE